MPRVSRPVAVTKSIFTARTNVYNRAIPLRANELLVGVIASPGMHARLVRLPHLYSVRLCTMVAHGCDATLGVPRPSVILLGVL